MYQDLLRFHEMEVMRSYPQLSCITIHMPMFGILENFEYIIPIKIRVGNYFTLRRLLLVLEAMIFIY